MDASGAKSGAIIVGHAAVFDSPTTIYEGKYYRLQEVIRKGAFKNAIKAKQDVRALFNHDPNFVLGRTTSGTLALTEDDIGLACRIDAPTTQTIEDLVCSPIERGDIDKMSFAFSIRVSPTQKMTENPDGSTVYEDGGQRITTTYDGTRETDFREILDADLYDVSPVTFPAYDDTDVSVRSKGIEQRCIERDVPRKASTPKLDEVRSWLASTPA